MENNTSKSLLYRNEESMDREDFDYGYAKLEQEKKFAIDQTSRIIECDYIPCNFEADNTCRYNDAISGETFQHANVAFGVRQGRFMNRITGISKPGEGQLYLASYLEPTDVSSISTSGLTLQADTLLSFQYYLVTTGIQMRACCDRYDQCPFISPESGPKDRYWKEAMFYCPKGTTSILFICENLGIYEGACGLDNIRIATENMEDVCAVQEKPNPTANHGEIFGDDWTYP